MSKASSRCLTTAAIAACVALSIASPAQAGPGDSDPTFSGFAGPFGFGGDTESATSVAIQPNGKVVVAGGSASHDQDGNPVSAASGLARLNADGSFDTSFDGDGKLSDPRLPSGADVAVQADGKIVVAGTVMREDTERQIALVRYRSDGSPDSTFGLVIPDFGGRWEDVSAVLIQPDGRIVVAGTSYTGRWVTALARFHSDGSPDASFAGDGTMTTALDDSDSVFDAALQSDGRIVVAGANGAVVRFGADGSLDESFTGTTGIGVYALAIQADGRIVAAGSKSWNPSPEDYTSDIALVRLNQDGTVDRSFGADGLQTTDFSTHWRTSEIAAAVAIQANGKIVVAGTSGEDSILAEGAIQVVLARYRTDGSPDSAFSTGAKIGFYSAAAELALQGDGKIVVAATTSEYPYGYATRAVVTRLQGDPVVANAAPSARFRFSCSGLTCYFDSSGSSDSDGTVASHHWEFGDGTSATGSYTRKVFSQYGTYDTELTVTDNGGATGSRAERISLLRLTGSGWLTLGFPRISLSWNAVPGKTYWLYRGSKQIGVITGGTAIDRPPVAASYRYTVCEAAGPLCSATETIHVNARGEVDRVARLRGVPGA